MKKALSLLLVLVMLLAMSTTAFAAEANGSITIDNAVVGETYTIYRLLELESFNSESGAYAYKATPAWETWLKTQTTYLTFDDQGYVTWVNDADVAAFAKAAKAYANANSITTNGTAEAANTTVKFEDLELGYYLVDTTLGTLCSLDTTAPYVTIREKNEEPSIDKTVEEDSTSSFGKNNDADIGQTVNFKITVTAKKGAENYVVHDILSSGLTLDNNSVTVKVGNKTLTKDTDYTLILSCDDDCSFHVKFEQTYLDTITTDTDVEITYSATINENAVVGTSGNPNKTKLDYGTNSSTEWDQTTTYVWDLDVLKYANGDESKVLAGAKFVLLNSDKTKVATVVNGKLIGWVNVPAEGAQWPDNTGLTTDTNGKIEIDGLDSDTYYLRELEAPKGYNKLASDVEVKITGAEKGEGDTLSYTTVVAKVNNQSGTELPSTGAKGTMLFITIGSLLAVAAVVFMVTRKKMSVYEK